MSDYIVRATAYDGQVRAFAVQSTGVLKEIQQRLDTWPTASAALGRSISAGAMMGAMLKGDDRVTLQVNGNGPLGQIVVDANAKGDVRGYVKNPHVDFPLNDKGKLDVARAVGTEGHIYVIKDLGLKEPYRGSSPIISGELGEDFTYYFATSEQTPSAVGVGVLVSPDATILASGGFIIQLLPMADEDVITKLEQRIAAIPPVSKMIQEGLSPEQLLEQVLGEKPNILSRLDIRFHCGCSMERAIGALTSLGKAELEDVLRKGEAQEITCHFCNEKYIIPLSDIERVLMKLSEEENE